MNLNMFAIILFVISIIILKIDIMQKIIFRNVMQ